MIKARRKRAIIGLELGGGPRDRVTESRVVERNFIRAPSLLEEYTDLLRRPRPQSHKICLQVRNHTAIRGSFYATTIRM